MRIFCRHSAVLAGLVALLMACTPSQMDDDVILTPVYNGVSRELLDLDLVNMQASMTGARDKQDVIDYVECSVAHYALRRGYGFARHVRTNVTIDSGIWLADAVYTISSSLPQGLRTIDAEVTVQNCATLGIPTV